MSPSNMMAKQAQRFRVELAIAALALAASGALGLVLARSLTMPLKAAIGALREIRGGNYRVHLPVTTGGRRAAGVDRRDVSLHGAVEVRSRPGQGTVVAIALPLKGATTVS